MAEKENKVKSDRPSVFSRIGAWFRALRTEAKKVSWASAESVRKNTLIVIVCVVLISAAIGVVDYLLEGTIVGLNRLIW